MKVTQEMLDVAKHAAPSLPIWSLQVALEAALADVPDPVVIDPLRNMLSVQRQRTEAAEARIAEALEALQNGRPRSELKEILDGSES